MLQPVAQPFPGSSAPPGQPGQRSHTRSGLSEDRHHALIRSVAVSPRLRASGAGSRLAHYALEQASAAGARRAWLFSRRSGPFWQKLGFSTADRHELAKVLPHTHQVRLFVQSGQLDREVAWSRLLST